MALVILAMPALVLSAGFVLDYGLLFLIRQELQAVADMAALAGVQEVDLEALSRGERRFLPAAPRARAAECARLNLAALDRPWLVAERTEVETTVYEPEPEDPLFHHGDRRLLTDPTLCVVIRARVKPPFLSIWHRELEIEVHADASVLPIDG